MSKSGGQLGRSAIVVGAGIGGLAAAAALAGKFGTVTMLDRDSLPEGASWRMGAGQGAHVHQLLKAGEQSLERLLPGITEDFYRAGAVDMRVGRDVKVFDFGGWMDECDVGFSVTSLSRPAYESILRRRVAALPGVTIRGETDVRRFTVEGGRCTGVELSDGMVLTADLVVDSSGMTGPLMRQLVEDGHAEYESEHIRINVAYTTARFRKPEKYRDEKIGFFFLPAPPEKHFGFILPIENDEWIISLGTRGHDAPPRDVAALKEYASKLPDPAVYDRIKDAEAVSELKTFRKGTATRRKIWEAPKWPKRLLPAGDALSSVNPTYGQGMTVTACAADALSGLLSKRAETGAGLDGLEKEYLTAAAAFAARAWGLSVNSDYVYPETEGERPSNFAMSRAVAATLRKLADEDMDFRVLRYRLVHMVDPDNVLSEGPLAIRFFTALQGSMAS
ncbi:MAG: tryptophan 7-halogenase [Hyphomonadaceae bacterium]|nr:tryptophan 7-halogenase [Hyphomonadaceae bacterium]